MFFEASSIPVSKFIRYNLYSFLLKTGQTKAKSNTQSTILDQRTLPLKFLLLHDEFKILVGWLLLCKAIH